SRRVPPKPVCAARRRAATARAPGPAAFRSCHLAWSSPAPLLLLAFFAEDPLVGIFDALAFIGFGRPVLANFGGNLADPLLVAARNDDLDRPWGCNRDALRDRIDDVVAVAERDLQVFALHGGAIADAADFKTLLEAFGDAGDQIVYQRARGAPLGTRALGLSARLDLDLPAFELDSNIVVQRHLQRPFRSFDLHHLTFDICGHAGRHRDGSFTDTRHQNTVQRISPPTLASRAS